MMMESPARYSYSSSTSSSPHQATTILNSGRKSRSTSEFLDRDVSVASSEILDEKKTIQEVIQMNTYYTSKRRATMGDVPSPAAPQPRTTKVSSVALVEPPLHPQHAWGVSLGRVLPPGRVDYVSLLQKQQEEYQRVDAQHQAYLGKAFGSPKENNNVAQRLEQAFEQKEVMDPAKSPGSDSSSGSTAGEKLEVAQGNSNHDTRCSSTPADEKDYEFAVAVTLNMLLIAFAMDTF